MFAVPSGVRLATVPAACDRVGVVRAVTGRRTGAQYATGRGPSATFFGSIGDRGGGGRDGSAEEGADEPSIATTATAAPISAPASSRAALSWLRRMRPARLTP